MTSFLAASRGASAVLILLDLSAAFDISIFAIFAILIT